jgi:hypothetical protein
VDSFSFTIRIYYQHSPDRLSSCPLTVHALLHIADSIKAMGPVWAYWAFPMERFCGTLQRAVRSRRFPYASIDRFVTETAQLNQIANVYDITGVLALRSPPSLAAAFSHHQCMYIFLKNLISNRFFSKIHHVYYFLRGLKPGLQRISSRVLLPHLQLDLLWTFASSECT